MLIHLVFREDLASFARYIPESNEIQIHLPACVGMANLDGKDPKEFITETLVHELLHAVQDNFGLLFEEEVIHAAMSDPAEIIISESELQAEQINLSLQQLYRDTANVLGESLLKVDPNNPALEEWRALNTRHNQIIESEICT